MSARNGTRTRVRRLDYRPPAFLAPALDLTLRLEREATRVTSAFAFHRNPSAAPELATAPPRPRRRGPARRHGRARWRSPAARALDVRRAGADTSRAARERAACRPRDDQPGRQCGAPRPLRFDRRVLHAMRGGGLPADRLLLRPPRRARNVHRDDHRGSRELPRPPFERQPRGRRPARAWPSFRPLARSVSQADVPVRAGRGRPRCARGRVHDGKRPRGRARNLVDAAQPAALRPRDGSAQARDALGRGAIRPRVRPRPLHDLLRRRFQHGRDGEQGPQHLQQQARARRSGDRDRRRLPGHRRRGRPRILPQLDRQPRHLPRLVPAVAEGRSHGFPRPGILGRHGLARGGAHRRGRLPAQRAISRGCRPDGASGAPRRIPRDQQLLHRDGLRKGRRGDPDAAHAARPRALPARHGPLLRAPRRAGGDVRRFRPGHGRCEPRRRGTRPQAIPPLVQSGGHAGGARRRSS